MLILNVTTTFLPSTLPSAVLPWPSTLHRIHYPSQYSYLFPFFFTTTFMQMTIGSSSLSTHSTLTQAFLTFKTLFNRSLLGWLLIFLLLTPLRLNSCSSDSKTNLPKYTTLHLTPSTLLETLVSSLTNILLSLTKLHLSPKPVTTTFVNFNVSGLNSIRQLIAAYHCYLYRTLQTWLM